MTSPNARTTRRSRSATHSDRLSQAELRAIGDVLKSACRDFQEGLYRLPWTAEQAIALWRELQKNGRTTRRMIEDFGRHAAADGERLDKCLAEVEERIAARNPRRPDPEREDRVVALLLEAELSHELLRAWHRRLRALRRELPAALVAEEIGISAALFEQHMEEIEAAFERFVIQRDRVVLGSLGLVVTFARDFRNQGMPLEDLIQEGTTGLLRAVERFDWDRGYQFSTYASWWIRHCIVRALENHGRTVRIPTHRYDQARRLRRVRARLQAQLGRGPTDAEVCKASGIGAADLDECEQIFRRTLSLEAPDSRDPDESLPLGELLEERGFGDPTDALELVHLLAWAHQAVVTLPARERTVLQLRFGLDGSPPQSLREVGTELGLSGERVRQLEAQALERLRRRAHATGT